MDPRTPCLIGIAQRTIREQPGPEPLDLWESVAREAAADARLPVERLDSIQIVWTDSWYYDSPVGRLAERLGAAPRHQVYSKVGGTAPQLLIGAAAAAIAAGELDSALIAGAEALATRRAYRKAGSTRRGATPPTPSPRTGGSGRRTRRRSRTGCSCRCTPIRSWKPRGARRPGSPSRGDPRAGAHHGADDRGRRRQPARLAQGRPHPGELAGGRFVGWPYTSDTVAVLEVDQAAAVVLASSELADRLGVPADQRVYLRGWAYAEDTWEVATRPALGSSPAIAHAAEAAFERAGLGLDDMNALDLYSCFAIALRQACDAIGLDPLDPRGLTVTGGLPYAGGPASDYVLHSTATMAGLLRAQSGHGLVSGVGMHLTKHTYAVWSSEPGGRLGDVAPVHVAKEVPLVDSYEGVGVVAGYTVAHGRDGGAEKGFLVVDVPGGRAYAVVSERGLLEEAEGRELVGEEVRVSSDGKVNVAVW
ncbi:acetyl-CoA synthetase [Nonomuraea thailandensis]